MTDSDTDYIDKLQANMYLGLGSNTFSIGGVLGAWVFFQRTEWIDDWWYRILTAFCLFPTFMGDALDAYFLGRIRLEKEKGWNDVQMLPEGKALMEKFFYLWRGLSLGSAVLLGLILLLSNSPTPEAWKGLYIAFPVVFALHFLRCQVTITRFLGPVVPAFQWTNQARKMILLTIVATLWLGWLYQRPPGPFSNWGFLWQGFIFFVLNSFLHPLPSKFSLLGLGKSHRPKLLDKVALIEANASPLAQNPTAASELKTWQSLGFSLDMGTFKMPLLELPLFEAAGSAHLHENSQTLFLLMKSEIRPRHHRSLISLAGDNISITTDFGSPEATFPDGFQYRNVGFETPPAAFLQEHLKALTVEPKPLPNPPWPVLNEIVNHMRTFLRRQTLETTPQAVGEKN